MKIINILITLSLSILFVLTFTKKEYKCHDSLITKVKSCDKLNRCLVETEDGISTSDYAQVGQVTLICKGE